LRARPRRFTKCLIRKREVKNNLASTRARSSHKTQRLHYGLACEIHRYAKPGNENGAFRLNPAAQAIRERIFLEIYRHKLSDRGNSIP